MKIKYLFLAIGLLLTSCSPSISAKRPDDFSLTYFWQEGSLPPPYHYEYTISIQPDGRSQIEMIPDYISEETPEWTEEFTLSEESLDQIYTALVDNNFFQTNWTAQADPPVGGSSDALRFTAGGREFEIPSFVPTAQQAAHDRIVAAINALVPANIWEKLDHQRELYMQEHQD